jgi:hypothetical protein
MPAFDESKRKKLFGVYTGCPCSLTLDVTVHTKNKNLPDNFFNTEVENLVKEWQRSCDKYFPGPRVAPRITQNWNKAIKLPYGKYADIRCVYDENGPMSSNYCKFSIRELISSLDQECQATGELHNWIETKDFSDPTIKYRCRDCGTGRGDFK